MFAESVHSAANLLETIYRASRLLSPLKVPGQIKGPVYAFVIVSCRVLPSPLVPSREGYASLFNRNIIPVSTTVSARETERGERDTLRPYTGVSCY